MAKGGIYSATHLGSRLDLHTLQIFMTAVDAGSLSEAAAREHLVVSAVSRRIALLEGVVGTPLLERRPGGIVPTSAGLELVKHIREIRAVLERIEEGLEAHREGLRGEVRLHANTSALIDRLPARVTAFIAQYPGVDVQVEERDSARVVRSVREGNAHVGVYSSYVPAQGLNVLPYTADRLVIIVPAGHPLELKRKIRFEDTLDYDHVVMQDGDMFSALLVHMQGLASRFAAPMRVRLRVASVGAACRFVEAGIGIAVLRETSARVFAQALRLSLITLTDDWASIRHDICVRDASTLPAAARRLADHLSSGEHREAAS